MPQAAPVVAVALVPMPIEGVPDLAVLLRIAAAARRYVAAEIAFNEAPAEDGPLAAETLDTTWDELLDALDESICQGRR